MHHSTVSARVRPLRPLILSCTLLVTMAVATKAELPATCVGDAISAERVALVIGNSKYPEPISGRKDALDMACYLRQLGFTVLEPVLDGEIQTIRDSLKDFGDKIARAKVIFFYFSGHGLQYQHENYLIPVSAHYTAKDLLKLSDVLKKLSLAQRRDAIKIIILDACRNRDSIKIEGVTPDGEGLAKVEDATLGRNTIVGFSTLFNQSAASGKPDENSPYTAVLLSHLREPGLELRDLMNRVSYEVAHAPKTRQQPWDEGGQNFDKPFYLRDQVRIKARINSADDNLVLLVNQQDVLSGNAQESASFGLRAGENTVEVRVFNDRTYRNHHTWESAEGWQYELALLDSAERPLAAPWSDHEDVVFKDGPHHGKWFAVARGNIYVDPGTAKVTLANPNKDVWRREGTPSYALESAILCKITVLEAVPILRPNTETVLLVGGPKSLANTVRQCFTGSVRTNIILGAVASIASDGQGAFLQSITPQGACSNAHPWYALEDHSVGELKSIPECDK